MSEELKQYISKHKNLSLYAPESKIIYYLRQFFGRNRIELWRYETVQTSYKKSIIFEDIDQIHFNLNDVKITFFNYPYQLEHPLSEKLFREQLAFHKDIDYGEEIEYIISNPPPEKEVKEELIRIATNI